MITYVNGDITQENTEAVVNPVNCEGVMGKGLAKVFADSYPRMYADYREFCAKGLLRPGRLHLYDISKLWHGGMIMHSGDSPAWYELKQQRFLLVNFPTKDRWRNPSEMMWVRLGLNTLRRLIVVEQLRSIAIPALGCGLGGLSWFEVKAEIEHCLEGLDCDIRVYNPVKPGRAQQAA